MELSNREWKEFKIGDLFIQKRGRESAPKQVLSGDKFPMINEIQANNGLSKFGNGKALLDGNSITVSVNFAQNVFYQKHSFYASVNILVLYAPFLNKNIGMFVANIIRNANANYNYAYKTSKDRLNVTKILLPINKSGNPDYEFMEEYTKKIVNTKKQEYIDYAKDKIKDIEYKKVAKLEDKDWKEFFTEDIFNIYSGTRLTKQNMLVGNTPFIGSSDSNNGITNFISNTNCSYDVNVLGVNYNGSVAETFYHPYGCVFSDDVKRFHLKHFDDNNYVLLFFKSIILKQKIKYSYAYKFNAKRMLRQYLMLPTNKLGQPDYEYMEQYIKNLMFKKYTDYLEYTNK